MISGNTERHVKSGSRLRLRCFVENSSGLPSFVYWYRNNKVVNYGNRLGVSVKVRTKKSRKQRVLPVSVLEINHVLSGDAGNYTCAPSNAKNHTIQVHVVKGKAIPGKN